MDWFQWLSQTTLNTSLVYTYGVLFACNDLTLNDVAYFDHDLLLSIGIKIGKHRLEILKLTRAQTRNKNLSFKCLVATVRCGLVRCAKKLTGGSGCGGGCRKREVEGLGFGRRLSPLQVEWKDIREEGVEERGIVRTGNVGFDGTRFLRSPGSMAITGEKKVVKSGPIGMRKKTGPFMGPRRYASGPINGCRPVKSQIARFSGPLDEKMGFLKSPSCSGPLDEQVGFLKSPSCSGPLDEMVGFLKSPSWSGPLDERLGMNKSPILSGQLDECCHSPWAMLFDELRPT